MRTNGKQQSPGIQLKPTRQQRFLAVLAGFLVGVILYYGVMFAVKVYAQNLAKADLPLVVWEWIPPVGQTARVLFEIERTVDTTPPTWVSQGVTSQKNFIDTTVVGGFAYRYRVRAFEDCRELASRSDPSNEASYLTPKTVILSAPVTIVVRPASQ